jgi:hypothetical protein
MMGSYVALKRGFLPEPHGVAFQKTAFFCIMLFEAVDFQVFCVFRKSCPISELRGKFLSALEEWCLLGCYAVWLL